MVTINPLLKSLGEKIIMNPGLIFIANKSLGWQLFPAQLVQVVQLADHHRERKSLVAAKSCFFSKLVCNTDTARVRGTIGKYPMCNSFNLCNSTSATRNCQQMTDFTRDFQHWFAKRPTTCSVVLNVQLVQLVQLDRPNQLVDATKSRNRLNHPYE